ncbi:hypothetical protein LWI29_038100 [Acer saccharum]|uniref:Uncharacterized protein n=1 Tax=Acer saccharum TaxID=4024 RepID=A0AA39SI46_ACESA|nr:hypothetical protein LWI29_038100 [Acer saccharum]
MFRCNTSSVVLPSYYKLSAIKPHFHRSTPRGVKLMDQDWRCKPRSLHENSSMCQCRRANPTDYATTTMRPQSSPFAVANVNSSSVSSYRTYNSGKAKGERPVCAYCGITGHTKDKCYKLHGFPPGFKFRNGNGRSSSNASAQSNFKPSINQTSSDVIEVVPSQFTPSNAVTGLSSDQCQQLIALLSSQLHTSSSVDSHPVVSNFTVIGSSIPSTTWIIDSGATHHVCHDLSLFSSFDIDFSGSSVQLPNGHMVAISKIGTVSLSLHLVLTKVLYVPDFKYNLLSISALLQSASCSLKFYADHCYIQDISQDSLIGMAYLINRIPSSLLQHRTSFQLIYNKPSQYAHLKAFGCLCYASTLASSRDKFSARSKACVFLGYPIGMKAYKLLDIASNKVFNSRDVYFHEKVFPFSGSIHRSAATHDLFDERVLPLSLSDSVDSNVSSSPILEPDCDSAMMDQAVLQPSNFSSTDISTEGSFAAPNSDSSPISVVTKSKRAVRRPFYLQDYHCALINNKYLDHTSTYPISNVLSYSRLSPSFRAAVLSAQVKKFLSDNH